MNVLILLKELIKLNKLIYRIKNIKRKKIINKIIWYRISKKGAEFTSSN